MKYLVSSPHVNCGISMPLLEDAKKMEVHMQKEFGGNWCVREVTADGSREVYRYPEKAK